MSARERSINQNILKAIKKSRHGVGLRLLAPTKLTKEELKKERLKLITLRTTMEKMLVDVTDELKDKEEAQQKTLTFTQEYNSLERALDTMEKEEEKKKKEEVSNDNDHRIESPSAAQERNEAASSEHNITRELQQLQQTINNQSFEHGTVSSKLFFRLSSSHYLYLYK